MKTKNDTVTAEATPTPVADKPVKLEPGAIQPELVHYIPLTDLKIADANTRHPTIKEPGIQELGQSMKQFGQTTPAIVRKIKGATKPPFFEIGAGSRRFVAAQLCGDNFKTLACVIRELDDAQFEELILVENLQREDPDPKAEVELLDRLVKRGVRTPEAISAHLGKAPSWVGRRLQLLKVVPELRKGWANQKNGISHFSVEMMSLLGTLPEGTQRELVSGRVHWQLEECTSRKELKDYLDGNILCRLDKAPFDLKDPKTFVKGCGPGCACSSANLGALFADETDEPARCMNVACFKQRLGLANKARMEELAGKEDLPVVSTSYDAPREISLGKSRQKVEDLSYRGLGTLSSKDTGGKKVIVVGANGAMRIGYMPKQVTAKGSPKGPKSSLADREKILQGKRWRAVHEKLAEALQEAKHTDLTEPLIDLVAIFGLPYRAEGGPYASHPLKHWKRFDERAKGYQQDSCKLRGFPGDVTLMKQFVGVSREEALWTGVKAVLADVMEPIGPTGDAGKWETDLRRVSKLIKFDLDAAKREADLKILPPKTWGKVDTHTLEPVKSPPKPLSPKTEKHVRKRGGLSPQARKKLAAAAKERWAKQKGKK